MVRVKRGKISLKKRRLILKKVKGYRWGRSKKEKQAREALYHAGNHAFQHRRKKKGDFRGLWNIRLNAALRENGTTYSKFINVLNKNDIKLNRKVLSEIAKDKKEVFKRVADSVKSN